ncbi:unnamed protein product [Durusdinium trenchii]|uniref:Uncharacterized protein n=1 Tax=Durusdinium trenchii TaxID=1381693 RepID=A0ABP0Q1E7_9DINO
MAITGRGSRDGGLMQNHKSLRAFFGGITQSCQTCSYPQPLATRHLFYRSENPMVKGCVHNRMLQLQRAGDPQNALRFAKCPHLHWCARFQDGGQQDAQI